ncbi:MAG: YkgJ family cysteine cluster protein [Cyanobacteria bacterium P01_D01_bin.123]
MKPKADRPSVWGAWHCVRGCGACCYLQPGERDELETYLTPVELKQYLSMVGEDGWCVHYQRDERTCGIYRNRPNFCRVSPRRFERMFGIEPADLPEFAAACCREHIEDIYGANSAEMQQFDAEIPL